MSCMIKGLTLVLPKRMVTISLENFSCSPKTKQKQNKTKQKKKSAESHIGNLNYILCCYFDGYFHWGLLQKSLVRRGLTP